VLARGAAEVVAFERVEPRQLAPERRRARAERKFVERLHHHRRRRAAQALGEYFGKSDRRERGRAISGGL